MERYVAFPGEKHLLIFENLTCLWLNHYVKQTALRNITACWFTSFDWIRSDFGPLILVRLIEEISPNELSCEFRSPQASTTWVESHISYTFSNLLRKRVKKFVRRLSILRSTPIIVHNIEKFSIKRKIKTCAGELLIISKWFT